MTRSDFPASPPSRESGATPAYASAPRRSGLLVALACVVALAAAGALAMFLFGATAPVVAVPKASSDDEKQALAAAKAALDEASRSVMQPQGAYSPAQDAPAPASLPAADASRPDVVARPVPMPVAEPPGTAVPPPPGAVRAGSKGDATKSAPRGAPRAAPGPAEPVVVAAAPAPVPSAAPAASPDRWAQMKAEIAQCWGSSVLGLQCERRVRVRYCEGYWGSVPECSTGRTDHGN